MIAVSGLLERIEMVPPLPGSMLRLIQVVNDPASTVNDIVEVIRFDQALTAQMLRLCNSAYFGLNRTITSVHEAIRYLGTLKVLQLVMAVHGKALLNGSQRGYGLASGALWRHSVAVALTSGLLADRTRVEPDVVFTAGLLHDIGKLVLSEYVAESFDHIMACVQNEGMSFTEAEHRVLGFSHEQVGARLAEKWRIPESIVNCIRFHHDPFQLDPPNPMVDTVYLAACVCLLLGISLGADGLCYRADAQVMQRHGLTELDLELTGAQVMAELKQVEELFAVPAQAAGLVDGPKGGPSCPTTS